MLFLLGIIALIITIIVIIYFKYKDIIIKNKKKVISIVVAASTVTAGATSILLKLDFFNFNAELIDELSDYEKFGFDIDKIDNPIVYESHCIVEGNLPLAIKVKSDKTININNIFINSIEYNSKNFKNIKYSFQVLQPYIFYYKEPIYESANATDYVSVYDYENNTYIWDNVTTDYYRIIGYNNKSTIRYKWIDICNIKSLSIKNDDIIIINIKGKFKANLGNGHIDIVPKVKINNMEKIFSEYAWWNTDWDYYKPIYIDSDYVDCDLTNFPILIYLASDAELAANAQSDFDDVTFISDDNTTQYAHEFEYFDSATGKMYAWVNITSLSSSSDTYINMYYGNAACASQEDAEGVWDSNFEAVWHMNSTSDSTSNNIDFDGSKGSPTRNSGGKIHYGYDFEVSDGQDLLTHSTFYNDAHTAITWESWEDHDDQNDYNRCIFSFVDASANKDRIEHDTTNPTGQNPRLVMWANAAGAVVASSAYDANNNMFYHVTSWSQGNNVTVVVNGDDNRDIQAANANAYEGGTYSDFAVGGADYEASYDYDGIVDEIRISNIVRSWCWINTTYTSINSGSNGSFFTVGAEVGFSGNVPPIVDNPYPANGSTCIACNGTVEIDVEDPDGDSMNLTWYSNSSGGWVAFGTNSSVGNGTYQQTNSNFTNCNTTYYWNVSVDDGMGNCVDSGIYHFTTIQEPFIISTDPSDNEINVELQPLVCIEVEDPCGESMDIYFYENTSGSWVQAGSNLSVGNGTYCFDYTEANTQLTEYWWSVNVSNSCCYINNTYSFTTGSNGTVTNVTIRTNNTGYFCYRGSNCTASQFAANITGFDEESEFISVWKNDTWDVDNWKWTMYYGDGSGNNFQLNRFDVVRINLDDGDDTIIVEMTDYDEIDNCTSRSVDLTYGTNRGYNYTCYCVNTTYCGYTTLKAVAQQSPLVSGQSVAWWNESKYDWEIWIIDATPDSMNHDIGSFDVFETKVSANRTWVMP